AGIRSLHRPRDGRRQRPDLRPETLSSTRPEIQGSRSTRPEVSTSSRDIPSLPRVRAELPSGHPLQRPASPQAVPTNTASPRGDTAAPSRSTDPSYSSSCRWQESPHFHCGELHHARSSCHPAQSACRAIPGTACPDRRPLSSTAFHSHPPVLYLPCSSLLVYAVRASGLSSS